MNRFLLMSRQIQTPSPPRRVSHLRMPDGRVLRQIRTAVHAAGAVVGAAESVRDNRAGSTGAGGRNGRAKLSSRFHGSAFGRLDPPAIKGNCGTRSRTSGVGKKLLVQAPQHDAALQRCAALDAVRRSLRTTFSGSGLLESTIHVESAAYRPASNKLRRCHQPHAAGTQQLDQAGQRFRYEAQAVFFDVPLEVCIERHNRRDRIVPEDVMRRMSAKLKAPTFEEGFAKITVVRVKQKAE